MNIGDGQKVQSESPVKPVTMLWLADTLLCIINNNNGWFVISVSYPFFNTINGLISIGANWRR